VALVGGNGAGKSTLLRLLSGASTPDGGEVRVGQTVRAAFLSQELVELPGGKRVLEAVEEVAKRVKLGDRELAATQLAELFGFTERRLWTHVADLSGGERRRLQLLRLLAAEPNVLLLDEPTNDLDTDTLAALEDLLDTWPGTMVVASHDRYLVERVCDNVFALPGDGTLRHLPGGIDEYLNIIAKNPVVEAVSTERTGGGVEKADSRTARKELARLERTIGKLEQREAALHEEMAAHATDYARVSDLDAQLRSVRAEREAAETQWLELAEQV
jgi:ABC-type multidrug transport system ATPase subunit